MSDGRGNDDMSVTGQRRRSDLVQYMTALGARGLSKAQARYVASAYNDVVLSPPLNKAVLRSVLSEAWGKVKEERKQEHFKDLHTVERKRVEFLIYPYLPDGALTILDGDPGMGKSLVTTDLGAVITTGGRFANRDQARRGRVLFMAPEDEADRILRPRLEAHGANLKKIRFMSDPFLLDQHGIEILRRELITYRPELVIIDPLTAFIPPETDTFRANEVRGFMRPLAMLASELNVAILVVRHLRKASSDSAIQRGQGSMDFIASVRSGLLVVEHPTDPDTRVFAQSKANYSRKGPSLTFEIKGYERNVTPTIRWLGTIEQTADQLMQGGNKKNADEAAADMIREMLAAGPMKARDAMEKLSAAGFADRTIDRAKAIAGVTSGRGPGATWRKP
jgi:hypothetical protein